MTPFMKDPLPIEANVCVLELSHHDHCVCEAVNGRSVPFIGFCHGGLD